MHQHNEVSDFDERPLSISQFVRIIREYRTAISLTVVSIAVLYFLVAVVGTLTAPTRRTTTLPFRLEFTGADRGEYPNGTVFSTSEIMATPILLQVYAENRVADFVTFPRFKSSLFITESNPALEAVEREYRAKLADPKLHAVDRERLESEFQQKRASIGRSDYSMTYVDGAAAKTLPDTLKAKILADILRVWAEQTVRNKGVVLYDLPILSSGIFEREVLDTYDYVIALDMLRSKISRVIRNIDDLADIPGAKVVRTAAPPRASLAELRVRLEDAVRFKIEPLVGMILNAGLSKNPKASIDFLQSRLTFNAIERQQAASRVETLRRSLETYNTHSTSSTAVVRTPGLTEGIQAQTIIPQIDTTFLDRLIALASGKGDSEFRQALVTRMEAEAMKVVPLDTEEKYYLSLIESLRGFEARARTAAPHELATIETQVAAVISEAIRTTDQVNEIYRSVSDNLNPSTILYSATAPASTRKESAIEMPRLILIGVLLVVVAGALAVVGSVIHHRLTSSAEFDEAENEVLPERHGAAAIATPATQPERAS